MSNLKIESIIKILTILLISLAIMLVFPDIVNAANGMELTETVKGIVTVDGSKFDKNENVDLSTLLNGKPYTFYNDSSDSNPTGIFQNNSLFCTQAGQSLFKSYNIESYLKYIDVEINTNGTVKKTEYKYKGGSR